MKPKYNIDSSSALIQSYTFLSLWKFGTSVDSNFLDLDTVKQHWLPPLTNSRSTRMKLVNSRKDKVVKVLSQSNMKRESRPNMTIGLNGDLAVLVQSLTFFWQVYKEQTSRPNKNRASWLAAGTSFDKICCIRRKKEEENVTLSFILWIYIILKCAWWAW